MMNYGIRTRKSKLERRSKRKQGKRIWGKKLVEVCIERMRAGASDKETGEQYGGGGMISMTVGKKQGKYEARK